MFFKKTGQCVREALVGQDGGAAGLDRIEDVDFTGGGVHHQ